VKRKQSSYIDRPRQRFASVALYQDDLNEILNSLKKRGLKIKLSDSDYEYETIDELAENRGDIIKSLSISGYKESSDRSVDFEFEKESIRLRADREDDLVASWQEIKGLLEKRVPSYARFLKLENWLWGFGIVALFGHDSIGSMATNPIPGYLFAAALTILGYGSIYSIIYRSQNSFIYLKRQHQILSFWKRNGEKILMLIIGAVIGGIAKGIGDTLFGK
jgi:hypothetical protein